MGTKTILMLILAVTLVSCGTSKKLPISKFYDYDLDLPLQESSELIKDTSDFKLYYITYHSVNNKKVTGLLTLPQERKSPCPVIILLHGMGDRKTVDYVEYGNRMFYKNGYAVLRIDIINHGDRFENDFEMDLTGSSKYWSRNILSQTVFDLRRAVDFIETREELDADNIGFFGISLGGITGTIFCGVEERVKVPIIILAGGQLNFLYGKKALTADAKDFFGFVEPKNYVSKIAPRPLLMINAENDEIIPPLMTKLLYKKAKQPKKIIWYPARHHTIPIDKAYQEGINWFNNYLY